MKDYLFRAIKSINSNAEFIFQEQNIDSIEWLNGTTPIKVNMVRYHNRNGKRIQFTAEEETARNLEEKQF